MSCLPNSGAALRGVFGDGGAKSTRRAGPPRSLVGRALFAFATWLSVAVAGPALAEPAPAQPRLEGDATLSLLVQQSLAARPELVRAETLVRAAREKAPQVLALPDPMLQFGIQNDGFSSLEVGRMGTSYLSVMASQTFPWPGKLDRQGKLAELSVLGAKQGLARVRLSTEAEVRREYLELLLVRERITLLTQLEENWQSAFAIARVQYQSGTGAQLDLLRAELELSRLKQRRIALLAAEIGRVQALNRLRGHPLDEPIPTPRTLSQSPALAALRATFSVERALARSPELASARLDVTRASRASAVAERGSYPDLTVGAGVMFRGALPPMWQVTVAGPVPVFSGGKWSHAVAESRALGSAAESEVRELSQLIRLRSEERARAFMAVEESLAVYEQGGLLLTSQASAESALIQYRAGKLGFAAVLEANAGYLADKEGALEALADAHRLVIAEAEVSLAAPGMANGERASPRMPGAGPSALRAASTMSAAPNASGGGPGEGSAGM